jgi:hypothetical protein
MKEDKNDLIPDMVVVYLKFQIVFNAKFIFSNTCNLQVDSSTNSKDTVEIAKKKELEKKALRL